MLYCPRCAIILEDGTSHCALCGSVPVTERPAAADSSGPVYPTGRVVATGQREGLADDGFGSEELSGADRRRIAFEIVSVIFGFALVVSLATDFFVERAFGWSRYSSVGILLAWALSCLPLLFWKKPAFMALTMLPAVALLVFLLDLFDGRITWYPTVGLPLILLSALTVSAVAAILRAIRRRGLNVIGVVLAAAGLLCIGIELILSLGLTAAVQLTWSPIVALALLPSAGFLFYLHYRIVKKASLHKLFRL